MKNLLRAIVIAAASAVSFAGGVTADDWTNTGQTVDITAARQYAVLCDGSTCTYLNKDQVNPDGTFKNETGNACAATGATCSWMNRVDAEAAAGTTHNYATDARYKDYTVTATDAKTGNTVTAGINGVTLENRDGSKTSVGSGGLATTGTVTASSGGKTTVLASDGVSVSEGSNQTTVTASGVTTTGTVSAAVVSAGVLSTTGYADVGSTLTSYGAQIDANTAGISNLNNLYKAQQGQIDAVNRKASKALESAAIVASLPQLHFGPGDTISVGAGIADAGGTGGWSLAAGALITPHVMVGLKGGMSGNTGVIAATGSMSFGGGASPLK